MPAMSDAGALPFLIPNDDDSDVATLIESWRYAGAPTPWSAIIGHEQQILRCQELVEKLRRSPEELAAVGIRIGAGMIICGQAGVGKTLLARAIATAAERPVIAPPTAEMTPSLITRLYAQLGKLGPSIVLFDEAEGIIGEPWQRTTDEATQRAFLQALDGVQTPAQGGPVTLALTTESAESLNEAATRPGRLAPRLQLGPPTSSERLLLLEGAIRGLPVAGVLDLGLLVERTAGWTGAELAGAAPEAMSRSLLDRDTRRGRRPALHQSLLLELIGERYVSRDVQERPIAVTLAVASHEVGHWLACQLLFPGRVAVVRLTHDGGQTQLSDDIEYRTHDLDELRSFVRVALAGAAAEELLLGRNRRTLGSEHDKERVTRDLLAMTAIERPWAIEPFEAGAMSDRGSERMRGALQVDVERRAHEAHAEVLGWLSPYRGALLAMRDALLAAPEMTLTGEEARAACQAAIDAVRLADGQHR